jgi:hypothetical protein
MSTPFKRLLGAAAAALTLATLGTGAQATVINLAAAGVTGNGPVFCGAGNAQSITVTAGGYDVVLSGGVALGPNISFLPATASVAYGTADFANGCNGQSGYTNPITVSFFAAGTSNPLNVTNFFIDLFNGNTAPITYTIADNLGNGGSALIANNTAAGQQTFGIPAAGNVITITGGPKPANACCDFDFFVNNIGFNEALPGGTNIGRTPEPATYALVGLALAGVWVSRRRRADKA